MSNTVQLQQAYYSGFQGCEVTVPNGVPPVVNVNPGRVRDQTNSFDIELKGTLSVDMTTKGIGGIGDDSNLTADTAYAVFVIGRSLATAGNQPAAGKVMALPYPEDLNAPSVPRYTKFLRDSEGVYDIGRFVGWAWAVSGSELETQSSYGNSSGLHTVIYTVAAGVFPAQTGPQTDVFVPFAANSRIPLGAVEILCTAGLFHSGSGVITGELRGPLGGAPASPWVTVDTVDRAIRYTCILPVLRTPQRGYTLTSDSNLAVWNVDAFGYRFEV